MNKHRPPGLFYDRMGIEHHSGIEFPNEKSCLRPIHTSGSTPRADIVATGLTLTTKGLSLSVNPHLKVKVGRKVVGQNLSSKTVTYSAHAATDLCRRRAGQDPLADTDTFF